MKTMKLNHFLPAAVTGLACLIFAGCASSPVKPTEQIARTPTIQEPVLPRLQAYPVNPAVQEPNPIVVSPDPQPVWKPTRIQRVQLDAYVDENGNLHRPSEMYVRVEQGGWNVDAVRRPGAYIPPENSVKPYDLPGMNYGPSYTVPKSSANQTPTALFDMRQVRITGLTSRADREVAQSMVGVNEAVIFDEQVGWIIVPQSAMQGVVDVPSREIERMQNNVQNGRVVAPGNMSLPRTQPQPQQPQPQPQTQSRPQPQQQQQTSTTDDLFDDL